jgi:hypothetical protein
MRGWGGKRKAGGEDCRQGRPRQVDNKQFKLGGGGWGWGWGERCVYVCVCVGGGGRLSEHCLVQLAMNPSASTTMHQVTTPFPHCILQPRHFHTMERASALANTPQLVGHTVRSLQRTSMRANTSAKESPAYREMKSGSGVSLLVLPSQMLHARAAAARTWGQRARRRHTRAGTTCRHGDERQAVHGV